MKMEQMGRSKGRKVRMMGIRKDAEECVLLHTESQGGTWVPGYP